jgi:hypothetical protein
MPGKVVPPVGCGQSATKGFAEAPQTLLLTREQHVQKLPRRREEADGRAAFRPHAIIVTDRAVPSPIFVAALVGVEKILRIDFDTSLPEATFVQQALAKLPEQTIAFGIPIGVTVNYAPDRAVRYDLRGDPIETLAEAIRCGKAYLYVLPDKGSGNDRSHIYMNSIYDALVIETLLSEEN